MNSIQLKLGKTMSCFGFSSNMLKCSAKEKSPWVTLIRNKTEEHQSQVTDKQAENWPSKHKCFRSCTRFRFYAIWCTN